MLESFGNALGIEAGTCKGGVGVVVVEHGSGLFLTHLVECIGSDVVEVDEVHASLCHYFSIPLAIGVVASLHLAIWPFVARCEAHENWSASLFAHILDEFLQVPAEGVNHFVLSVGFHLIDMAGVGSCTNDGTLLLGVDVADVVVPELNQYIVAWLNGVIDFVPASFFEECACGTSGLGCVNDCAFITIEHGEGLCAPTPHAIFVLVVVLHGGVASEEHAWLLVCFFCLLGRTCHHPFWMCFEDALWLNLVGEDIGLQFGNLWVVASVESFSAGSGIHLCAKGRGMDFVAKEMVGSFPLAVSLELAGRDVVEVDVWRVEFLRHRFNPRREGGQLAVDAVRVALLVSLARSEGEENRSGSLRTDFADEAAQITSEGIDHFLLSCLFDRDKDGVGGESLLTVFSLVGRTGAVVVDRTVVVMSEFKNHIVALLNAFQHVGP